MKNIMIKISGAALTIFLIISISFCLIHLMPGEPIINLVGQEEYYYLLENNPEELHRIAEKYGLNDSMIIQYRNYLKSVVRLDFGRAYFNHEPVTDNVLKAAKYTLLLSIPTWVLGGLIGGILGTMSGWKPGGRFDKIMTPFFLFINTIPSNCLGLLLLMLFAYKLRWFPINGIVSPGVKGMDRVLNILWHMVLPLTLLVLGRTSGNFMLMKSSVSQVRKEDYILTAVSKGLSDRKTLFIHVLRNAMLPYGTSLCMQLGYILSGAMIVEVVFGWKGMGLLMYNAVSTRDFPTAQLCFLISAVCVVGGNLLGDLFNMMVDPRLKDDAAYD